MSLKAHLAGLESHLAVAKQEEIKLAGGCKASAARLRNALLEIGKICSEARKDALDIGKSIIPKKRASKDPSNEPQPDVVESDGEKKDEPVPMVQPAFEVVSAPVKRTRAPRKPKAIEAAAPPPLPAAIPEAVPEVPAA